MFYPLFAVSECGLREEAVLYGGDPGAKHPPGPSILDGRFQGCGHGSNRRGGCGRAATVRQEQLPDGGERGRRSERGHWLGQRRRPRRST